MPEHSGYRGREKEKRAPYHILGLDELSLLGKENGFNCESCLCSPGGLTPGGVCVHVCMCVCAGETEEKIQRESSSNRVYVDRHAVSVCILLKTSGPNLQSNP